MITMEKSTWLVVLMFVVSAGVLMICTISGGSEAETITVDDDGGGDYDSIQDAINASKDGDTVRVFEGTYRENVIVNRSIALIGNGSSNTSIIGSGNIVWIRERKVEVSGFSIIGDGESKYYRACIIIDGMYGGGRSKIHDNHCSNNRIGIFIDSANGNSLINNSCHDNDYGIRLSHAKDSTITGNSCNMNTYGIYVYDYDKENAISENSLYDNEYDLFSESDEHQKDADRKFFLIVGSTAIIVALLAILFFPPWRTPSN